MGLFQGADALGALGRAWGVWVGWRQHDHAVPGVVGVGQWVQRQGQLLQAGLANALLQKLGNAGIQISQVQDVVAANGPVGQDPPGAAQQVGQQQGTTGIGLL